MSFTYYSILSIQMLPAIYLSKSILCLRGRKNRLVQAAFVTQLKQTAQRRLNVS